MRKLRFVRNWFRWQPTKETLVPFTAGLVIIALSWSLIPTSEMTWLNIAIHDLLMVTAVGIFLPLWFIRHSGDEWVQFGLATRRWPLYLLINFILGGLLLLLFLDEVPLPPDFRLSAVILWQIAFIMLNGIFEVLFFYSFQRTLFERAFGAVPAILLASAFYAFHHIGFQPEVAKLFPVGLIYAVTFRIGNSALLIYPFFWGVGACYDVLVQSQVVWEILYPAARTILLTVLIGVAIIWARRPIAAPESKDAAGARRYAGFRTK